jgi:hypothetical protein
MTTHTITKLRKKSKNAKISKNFKNTGFYYSKNTKLYQNLKQSSYRVAQNYIQKKMKEKRAYSSKHFFPFNTKKSLGE